MGWSLGVLLFTLLTNRTPFPARCGRQCGWEEGSNCPSCFGILLAKITHFTPDLVSPPWNTISPHCKLFLTNLLAKDPKERMTAGEAADHQWFKSTNCNNGTQNQEKETRGQEVSSTPIQPLLSSLQSSETVGGVGAVSEGSKLEANNWLSTSHPFVSVCLSMEADESGKERWGDMVVEQEEEEEKDPTDE